ncbi:hypothetical protein [Zunongwangia sp. HRR-M8]|uniref:hypothetical protein n=1 Tax=Zunongwangia sp. HRR-M8 TaxID=3015170 RepID=UPI0022DE2A14|nr:hypothetical protein [Zunongwangia sp. HRR-M8]WBL23675.1 hypothetical protein PBT89_06885 [Zunongwangia sp. HRR-M8]
MKNIYFEKPSREEKSQHLKPKKETIKFLLNYSKALKVLPGKTENYEMLLN